MPKISIATKPSADSTLVIGVSSAGDELNFTSERGSALGKQAKILGISGEPDTFTKILDPSSPQRVLAVTGIANPGDSSSLRNAAAVATRQLSSASVISFDFATDNPEDIEAIAEGALLGVYTYSEYKSTPAKKPTLTKIEIITRAKKVDFTRAVISAEAISLVKNLVNTPPNELYPETFVSAATTATKGLPLKITTWDEKALAKDGFGGILGVGKGSSRPPRLMKISYSPAKSKQHLALVGKGITFDSGGLSLKSGPGMIGMKYDMTGAATALAVIIAAAKLASPIKITAWLALAENMPSGTAIRPNDVLTIRGGKTVEVLNTDAEGRLVLADALSAASEEHPDLMVDIATLTGAASTALGLRYTGAMGNSASISHLMELSATTGEQFWHMPLPEELRGYLKSDVADYANIKAGNTAAGMLIGATFLQQFVGKSSKDAGAGLIPWIHLDIANTANNSGSAYGCVGVGPTGVATRTLIKLSESLPNK